jgi:uncharacterized protein YehS (DUF1456 family)
MFYLIISLYLEGLKIGRIKLNRVFKNQIMNKFDEKVAQYAKFMSEKGLKYDPALLTAVTKGLGPSIYKSASETVSGSNAKELLTIKNNFLTKKLGLIDDLKFDAAIHGVLEAIGKVEKLKYRAVVYYLLVVKFGKQAIYKQ